MSKRQIEANRANAAKSTGPRTSAGKQYRAVTLISMAYLVGREPPVLASPALMKSSQRSSKERIWKPRFEI